MNDINNYKISILDRNLFGEEKYLSYVLDENVIISDFSILLGGKIMYETYKDNIEQLQNRCGYYWKKDQILFPIVSFFDNIGKPNFTTLQDPYYGGVRPHIETDTIVYDKIQKKIGSTIMNVEYGYYPQMVPSDQILEQLENAYNDHTLSKTKISYFVPKKFQEVEMQKYKNINNFIDTNLSVYLYKENMYVRVPVHFTVLLSNGKKYQNGDYTWIKVEPIEWIVYAIGLKYYLISKKILFAGVPYIEKCNQYVSSYEDSSINQFIQEYWQNDITKAKKILIKK